MFSVSSKMGKIVKLVNGISQDDIAYSAMKLLRDGKIIAVPSDTLYGIGSLAQNDVAVKSIYDIKGRDDKKPISICVSDISDISRWGVISFPKGILYDLLPGPVTLVMERQPALNKKLNPGFQTIGIRIPKYSFIQRLAALCDEPLALTSANISSMSSTLAIEEFKEIWPHLDLIVDGGVLGQQDPNRLGSTVVNLSVKGWFKIIRPGCFYEETRKILRKYNLKEL